MGKVAEEEPPLPSAVVVVEASSDQNAANPCGGIRGLVKFKCVLVLVLSAAVLLSAIFWLPPFLKYQDQTDLDLDSLFRGHEIVASFKVKRPVSFLEGNILRLEDDIFDEIGVTTTKVVILYLEPSAASNTTKVVFAVDPDKKYSRMFPSAPSLIRSSFVFLVTEQSSLRLTTSFFGEPSSFEVLKFQGGITVIPPQSAYLLQKVQILFNFTLNFSIHEIQGSFGELTSQLKSGLHLVHYENLYISLTNSKGSTVSPPTTIQTSVLLAIGITPSMPRLKQLAQTITDSHEKNLGLNNTVFGRVKQVSLSSILKHSLHGGDGSDTSWSPSPAPLPHSHQHHHHRHHHRHHHSTYLAPAIALAPTIDKGALAPERGLPKPSPAPINDKARPPGCQIGYGRRFHRKDKGSHLVPTVAPMISPLHSAASPRVVDPPAAVSHKVPSSSPLPSVAFSQGQPPAEGESDAEPPDITPAVSLPLSSSSTYLHNVQWAFPVFLALVLHL